MSHELHVTSTNRYRMIYVVSANYTGDRNCNSASIAQSHHAQHIATECVYAYTSERVTCVPCITLNHIFTDGIVVTALFAPPIGAH
eukprot:7847027-Pyramimonas_sp.AAC.1